MNYNISRYEETPYRLFISLLRTDMPVSIERFFEGEDIASDDSKKKCLEKLVAELDIVASEYQPSVPIETKQIQPIEIKSSRLNELKGIIIEEKNTIVNDVVEEDIVLDEIK